MGVKNSHCKEPQKNLTFALPHKVFLAHLIHLHSDASLMSADSPSVLFTTALPVPMAVADTYCFWQAVEEGSSGLKAENTYFKWKLST